MQTHELFPTAARARVVSLMLLGHLLSREPRFEGVGGGLLVCEATIGWPGGHRTVCAMELLGKGMNRIVYALGQEYIVKFQEPGGGKVMLLYAVFGFFPVCVISGQRGALRRGGGTGLLWAVEARFLVSVIGKLA